MIEIGSVFVWWFLLFAMGTISFPIAFMLCRNLHDKGYAVSKILGLMISSFICFLLSYFFYFGFTTIIISMAAMALFSAACFLSNRENISGLFNSREFVKIVIITELVFLLAFSGFSFVRAYDPDILDGEKRMELAFANAAARSDKMPPSYPWYSGESLGKYYYFGHYITAFMSVLSSTPTQIAYNLALAMFFAFTAVLSFSFFLNMTKRAFFGIVAVFFMLFLANIFAFMQIVSFLFPEPGSLGIEGYAASNATNFFDRLWGSGIVWQSTRIIPWSINEFPYFSFIWGDLHHTLMAIPFRILIMILCYSIMLNGGSFLDFRINKTKKIFSIAMLSFCLGFMIPLSTWDFPVMAMFSFACIYMGGYFDSKSKLRYIAKCMAVFMAIGILSLLLFLPTISDISEGRAGMVNIEIQRTSLYHFMILFPLFIFLFASFSTLLYLSKKSDFSIKRHPRKLKIEIAAFLIVTAILLLAGYQVAAVLLPISFIILKSISRNTEKNSLFAAILIMAGILLVFLCEFINIGGRYISLFKFYLQIWVFWALAAAYIAYAFREKIKLIAFPGKWRKTAWIAWTLVFIFLLATCSVYIFVAGYSEIILSNYGKAHIPTLDGLAYLANEHGPDLNATMWINENIKGAPVILEVPGRVYTYTSRVSWITGLPTILGWEHHVEGHLSLNYEEMMNGRSRDADTIYNTTDNYLAAELIRKYNVSYIYVGELERNYKDIYVGDSVEIKKYEEEGLRKFEIYKDDYNLVYNASGVQIYEVVQK